MENDIAEYDLVTTWSGNMSSRTHCQSCFVGEHLQAARNHIIDSDEPEALGGEGQAPNPQQLILAAFNACMTAAFIHEAARLKITVEHLNIQTTGKLYTGLQASSSQSIDNRISYTINVKGKGSLIDFERIHNSVINSSPTRWLLSQSMIIEGDLVFT